MKIEIKNCWEYTLCGREPGGRNTSELGVCPAALTERFHGINGGKNAGRFCWYIAGTFCNGEIQGTFARKLGNCLKCEFYLEVESEEGRFFILTEDDIHKRYFDE